MKKEANSNGKVFEEQTDLAKKLFEANYVIKDKKIYLEDTLKGLFLPKTLLYKYLSSENVVWSDILSKQYLPDECVYNYATNELYIIEKKFQKVSGSVDEKLETFMYKKKQYQKLVSALNWKIKFIFVANDYFKKNKFNDIYEEFREDEIEIYFDNYPLEIINL